MCPIFNNCQRDSTFLLIRMTDSNFISNYYVLKRDEIYDWSTVFRPPKRRRVSFRVGRMQCSDQEVVERVMSFYMLSPAILDQLPLPENISVQESPEFLHLLPIEKLLYDLESIIINKCEVSILPKLFASSTSDICSAIQEI